VSVFRYQSYTTDAVSGLLTCRYSLDDDKLGTLEFTERVTLAPGPGWATPQAQAAARLVFLLAGVSYYKTGAPGVIDLGETALTPLERHFLRDFYLQGLGEYAYRNNLDLSALEIRAPEAPAGSPRTQFARDHENQSAAAPPSAPAIPGKPGMSGSRDGLRALIPFGGGIDSIVTVEKIRALAADCALFVVSKPGARFDAIEAPAAVAGLPVVRAGREIDPQLLRSAELGFRNGHVPVTGIISAIAILAATLGQRDAVIMSNEWSASVPTLEHDGRPVNHQYSKSASFEAAFRAVRNTVPRNTVPLDAMPETLPEYFSALRDRTELWVGAEFAALPAYHGTFRSCNRAFHIDPARRLDHWCGQCDKCCFIDLILAPFMSAAQLRDVFSVVPEPLTQGELAPKFRTLLGSGTKPFECVGEVSECRAAVLLAARRPDRAGSTLLQELAAEVASRPDAPTEPEIAAMREPVGENFIPARYAFGGHS
jgi:UDP-N-acetyl-alpha-D-muramoyl-L-alanyl-L-glutamate epimerase